MIHKNKAQENGKPNEQQRTSDEPLPKTHHTHTHQLQSGYSQINQNKERGDTKTVIDQITCQLSSPGTCIVFYMIIYSSKILGIPAINDTLVGCSGEKEGGKSQQQID